MLKHELSNFLRCGVVSALSLALCDRGAAQNQRPAASDVTLNLMIAAGRSPRELGQYVFDTHGCKDCHTVGKEGKLGFTARGTEKAKGFEGCISTLKAMTVIAKVPESQRSVTQRRRAQRFEEFGCATCHQLTPGQVSLTELGAKLARLHLGCVDVQKVLAGIAGSQR